MCTRGAAEIESTGTIRLAGTGTANFDRLVSIRALRRSVLPALCSTDNSDALALLAYDLQEGTPPAVLPLAKQWLLTPSLFEA